MKTKKFTYWQDGDYYLGFLNDYPDYQTQGMSKEELVKNLKDPIEKTRPGQKTGGTRLCAGPPWGKPRLVHQPKNEKSATGSSSR